MLRPSWYCWIPLFSWWSHFTEKLPPNKLRKMESWMVMLECENMVDLYLDRSRVDPSIPGSILGLHESLNGWGMMRNGKNHGFNIRNDFAHFFVPLSTVGISIYSQTVLLLEMLEKTISYLQVDQLLLNAHRMHVLFIKSWHWKVVSPKSIKDTGFRTRYLRHL